MNIYKLSQEKNSGYDTYDSCIVVAKTRAEAIKMPPDDLYSGDDVIRVWTSPEFVTAEFIGKAKRGSKKGVICASFNAG